MGQSKQEPFIALECSRCGKPLAAVEADSIPYAVRGAVRAVLAAKTIKIIGKCCKSRGDFGGLFDERDYEAFDARD